MRLAISNGSTVREKESGTSGHGIKPDAQETGSQSRTGKITQKSLYALLEQQEFKCALTGRKLEPETATLDHIVPLNDDIEGHVISNIQIVHVDANRAKGVLSQDEFVALCREVVAHATVSK